MSIRNLSLSALLHLVVAAFLMVGINSATANEDEAPVIKNVTLDDPQIGQTTISGRR